MLKITIKTIIFSNFALFISNATGQALHSDFLQIWNLEGNAIDPELNHHVNLIQDVANDQNVHDVFKVFLMHSRSYNFHSFYWAKDVVNLLRLFRL